MLLTSSQVSVLITSGIVLLCTSALFISGCLIQQRTLRDLRSAIRPAVITRPRPKVYTYANADLNGDVSPSPDASAGFTTKRIRLVDGSVVEIQSPVVADGSESGSGPEDGEVVEVRLTPEEEQSEKAQAQPDDADNDNDNDNDGDGDGDNDNDNDHDDGELKVSSSWDGVQEGGKPISRAERRRLIKAEIQRLSRGDAPVYYQRRLW
ncbi:hypothetical protein F5Y14DRAFT_52863 [Nemania sp. NC0429]|nr:hypothetical protein F5Y14DRAFT_52863 [Nemania sp. NC0429]